MGFEIKCDPSITGTGELSQKHLDVKDKCSPKLTFSHSVGCPVFEATSIVRFLAENPWILGIFLIVLGAIVTF